MQKPCSDTEDAEEEELVTFVSLFREDRIGVRR